MREFLRRLRDDGDLALVERRVEAAFELAAVTQRIQATTNQAVMFTHVAGTRLPVVSNVFGSRARLGAAIGVGDRGFPYAWDQIISGSVSRPEYPQDLSDHTIHGRLRDLPPLRYSRDDGGDYLTGGIFLAREPESGVANLSFHRAMYAGEAELRVRLAPGHHLAGYHAVAERHGQDLDAAILIGASPHLFLAAASRPGYGDSELDIAARLAGRPLRTRPGRTVELDIPLDADIVIEGHFRPGVRRSEGPFGEFMGYYVDAGDNAVFEVTDVSWRGAAVFHSINCGSGEEALPLGVLASAATYRHLSERLPGIADVVRHPRVHHDVVALEQLYDGHSTVVLRELMDTAGAKMCTVVDTDVDIYDLSDVLWATLTRARPQAILRRTPVRSFEHDPQVSWGRFGIDACAPYAERHALRRTSIPGAERIDLADYVTDPSRAPLS